MNNAIKQLIQIIGQAGGTVAIPIQELQELGVEITLENICDARHGRVVLRLGPKIYYVPQAQAQVPDIDAHEPVGTGGEAWNQIITESPRRTSSFVPAQPAPALSPIPDAPEENPVDLEIEAINRITNRPRPRPRGDTRKAVAQRVAKANQHREVLRTSVPPVSPVPREGPREGRNEDQPLPYSPVGVHRLNDMELWLQEQVRAEGVKTRERGNRAQVLRNGDLPFRTIPGR
jgi:hypothetical protein